MIYYLKKIPSRTAVLVLKAYRLLFFYRTPKCRFLPTCSEYAIEAVSRKGVFKGCFLIAKRLFKCHPWGSSGYDPVP